MPVSVSFLQCGAKHGEQTCQGQLKELAKTVLLATRPPQQAAFYICGDCSKIWWCNCASDGRFDPDAMIAYDGQLTPDQIVNCVPLQAGTFGKDMEERLQARLHPESWCSTATVSQCGVVVVPLELAGYRVRIHVVPDSFGMPAVSATQLSDGTRDNNGFSSDEELAIEELCKQQELPRVQVLRQALRTYQAVVKGAATVSYQQPCAGALAVCSIGRVGVIQSMQPIEVNYDDGNKGQAWTGTCIWPKEYAGSPWSSRSPTVIWGGKSGACGDAE